MFPNFRFLGVTFPTFPFVIIFAIFTTAVFYIFSPKYSKKHVFIFFRSCVPFIICAAIGGRIFSAITLTRNTDSSFGYNLLFGGSVFYGGLIGGLIGLCHFCKNKELSFFDFSDVLASIFPLCHAIGRFGCFCNGCCFGKEYNGLFSIRYPVNGITISVFPTWFFEIVFCILIFVFFQFFCKSRSRGFYTSIYSITYSIFRFFIEFTRGDQIRGIYGVFSTSQWISIIVLLFGVSVLLYFKSNKSNNILFRGD